MADSPNIGLDLYDLWKAGEDDYPAVAGDYARACTQIEAAGRSLSLTFWRPASFGGDAYGPAYRPWCDLSDSVLRFLQQTESNLRDTAAALIMAVNTYCATDAEAAAAFQYEVKIRESAAPSAP